MCSARAVNTEYGQERCKWLSFSWICNQPIPGPYIHCTGHDDADDGYLDDDDDADGDDGGGGGDYGDENDWICNQPIPYPWPKT